MDDTPELPWLKPFPLLHDAVEWLDARVNVLWGEADKLAIKYQRRHEWLARTAILTGVGAIILAIAQLALKPSLPAIAAVTIWIEGGIVLAGLISVTVGLSAKSDRKWLGCRHHSERLRMLKFSALAHPDLWKKNTSLWQDWVENQIKNLSSHDDYNRLETWSKEDSSETGLPAAGQISITPDTRRALVLYYRYKRILNQEDYFHSQGRQANANWGVKIRHQRERIFYLTIGFVLFHILADFLAGWMEQKHNAEAAWVWNLVAMWGIVMAAVLPVGAIGVRAWSAAFELSRKARSYEAKTKAMQKASIVLGDGSNEFPAILSHLRYDELFLEQEHRDWLRLLLEAEWFI